MNPTYDFDGQLALVTGAGAGVGLDTARAFAASGAVAVNEDHVAGLVERTVAEFAVQPKRPPRPLSMITERAG